MCPSSPWDARVFETLAKFDEDLAAEARAARCPVEWCGGRLDRANYPRKPRGASLPGGYERRFSFCCAEDDCRRRVTPPSLRFLGPKVYVGVVVVLMSALRHGVTDGRARALRRACGASRATLARWRHWWMTAFVATSFWRRARARLHSAVVIADLPASLLARFDGEDETERAVRLLDFIKPVTTGSASHLERISMGV